MKKKKLLSAAMVSTLAAAQLALPATAASGTVNVPVQVKNAVIRVEVPTSLYVAIDEFEIGDAGTQINSANFTMTNKSSVPVQVSVDSKATLANGTTLAASPSAATGANDMWLAVAAKTSATANKEYGELKDLNDASDNVATFAMNGGNATASQVFYLAQGTGNTEYKYTDSSAANYAAPAYTGEYFALAEQTLTATQEQDELDALVAAGKTVIAVVTASPAEEGDTLTEWDGTYAGTNTYYAVDFDTPVTDVTTSAGKYLYAEQQTAGGTAAFRYVGKLSEAKAGWTNADLTTIAIDYTITGVPTGVYDNKKDDCNDFGLYTTPAAPSIASTDLTKTAAAGTEITIPVNLGAASLGATTVESVMWKEGEFELLGDYATYSNGVVTILDGTVDYMLDNNYLPFTVTVIFDDDESTEVDVTVTAAP